MVKDLNTSQIGVKIIIILIIVVIILAISVCFFQQKEAVVAVPVKVEINSFLYDIQFEIVSGNILDIKGFDSSKDEYFYETKKLSKEACEEINLIIQSIAENKDKINKPSLYKEVRDDYKSVYFIQRADEFKVYKKIDGTEYPISEMRIRMKATIADEVYFNVYGRYKNDELDHLDRLTYKLLKESPIRFEFEEWIEFSENKDSN